MCPGVCVVTGHTEANIVISKSKYYHIQINKVAFRGLVHKRFQYNSSNHSSNSAVSVTWQHTDKMQVTKPVDSFLQS